MVKSMRDTKQQLIRKGTKLFTRHSFQGTGINDVLREARAPKGSFYHFFSSKENFACEVLASQARYNLSLLQEALNKTDLNYLRRILAFFKGLLDEVKKSEFRYGCLLGTIGQEMAANSESLRQAVAVGFEEQCQALAEGICKGQQAGDINKALDPQITALFIFSAMQGGILMAKVKKNDQPFQGFLDNIMLLLRP
ncbi:MAG: TetR/AcrR family transcriptional regulator [Desulfarculales bacterium]|jgi:TetR/AcrR family transcriptional repressor of nem operon|nr:TetR/AcrR family transcriptional regulator [Desulfarculales bacterium]